LPILFSNIARGLALTAAKPSAKHFGVKVTEFRWSVHLMLSLHWSQFQILIGDAVAEVNELELTSPISGNYARS